MRLDGRAARGVTATDLVLTLTELLRKHGVVGQFVEFCGDGLGALAGRPRDALEHVARVRRDRCALPGRRRDAALPARDRPRGDARRRWSSATPRSRASSAATAPDAGLLRRVELDLGGGRAQPGRAAPAAGSRAAGRRPARELPRRLSAARERERRRPARRRRRRSPPSRRARTPRTPRSWWPPACSPGTPSRAACTTAWVKTSLAPGSRVVTDYLDAAGLQEPLDALGFQLVGYGCTTCIGNSGPLSDEISQAVRDDELAVGAVLSGNRNFEGRIHPLVRASYLASPPLVVAYALAGSVAIDLENEPLGTGSDGARSTCATSGRRAARSREALARVVTPELFEREYARILDGDERWRALPAPEGALFAWDPRLDLRARAVVLRAPEPTRSRHRRRALPRRARRLGHDRPHLAGRRDPARHARRALPASSTASRRATSTRSARGAATTR